MSRLLVIGSCNQDFIWRTATFPVPGQTRLGQFSTGPGGKGFNQAVAAARQGGHVDFIAALGRDDIGRGMQQLAQSEGIRAHWQWCEDVPSGSAAIVLDDSGQNFIIVGSGANLALSEAHVQAQAECIRQAHVVLAQHEVTPAATRMALQLAHQAGALTVLNPAPALPDEDGGLLPLVDVVTPNETEFAQLLACFGTPDVDAAQLSSLGDAQLHQLALRLPVSCVIITLGAAGVFVSHRGHTRLTDHARHYRVPAEAVNVLDTTGAGDAFNGALVAYLAEHPQAPLRAAVTHANRCAGLACEAHGATAAMPTRSQVQQRFGG